MIRRLKKEDKSIYLEMATAFYQSDAVLNPIPGENLERTFALLMTDNPYASAFLLEEQGEVAGYVLLAHSWSQEAGGEVLWVEEIYVRPEFRGRGLARECFRFLEEEYPQVRRFRLEVETENERAVSLYRSLGYSFFGYDPMKKGL